MDLGRVLGTVIATRAHGSVTGIRLLVVQPEDLAGRPLGEPLVAADATQAGPGERVHLVHGREAGLAFDVGTTPIDLAIVGIVSGTEGG